jgi:porin
MTPASWRWVFPGATGALIIAEAKLPIGAWLLQLRGWPFNTQYDALRFQQVPGRVQRKR